MIFKKFLISILLFGLGFSAHAEPLNTGNLGSFEGPNQKQVSYRRGNFSVSLKKANLKQALQFLGNAADINLLVPEGLVDGEVSLNLNNIDLMSALKVLMKTNGLDFAVENNIVRVGPAAEFKQDEDFLTSTVRLKYATSAELENSVKPLLTQKGKVISDSRTNTITIKDLPDNVSVIKQMIQVIDIQDAQVLIQAKIVQVSTDFLRDIGVQWGVDNTTSGSSVRTGGLPVSVGTDDFGQAINVNLPATTPTSGIGLLLGRFANFQIDFQLTAAEEKGDIRIVSKPAIVTSNGQPANIRSGETLLVKTLGSTAGESGELKEIKTGVELKVTPQISIDDQIKLTINATTSLADFSRQVDGVPIIVDNVAETTVLVRDKETTVIGGLLQLQKQRGKKGVPYLSRIPLLGSLFKSRFRSNKNTELMIFIKPTIVRKMPVKIGYPYPDNPETAAEPKSWPSISMEEPKELKKRRKQQKQAGVIENKSTNKYSR